MVAMSATPGAEQNGSGGSYDQVELVRLYASVSATELTNPVSSPSIVISSSGPPAAPVGDCKTSLTDLSVIDRLGARPPAVW